MRILKNLNTKLLTSALFMGGALVSIEAIAKGRRTPTVERNLTLPRVVVTPIGDIELAAGPTIFYQPVNGDFETLASGVLNKDQIILGIPLEKATRITLKDEGNFGMGSPGLCDLELTSDLTLMDINEGLPLKLKPALNDQTICINKAAVGINGVTIQAQIEHDWYVSDIRIAKGEVTLLRLENQALEIIRGVVGEPTLVYLENIIVLRQGDSITRDFYGDLQLDKLHVSRSGRLTTGPNGIKMGSLISYSFINGSVLSFSTPHEGLSTLNGLDVLPGAFVSLNKNGTVRSINALLDTTNEFQFGSVSIIPSYMSPVFFHNDGATLMGVAVDNAIEKLNLEDQNFSNDSLEHISKMGNGFVGYTPQGNPKILFLVNEAGNHMEALQVYYNRPTKTLEIEKIDPNSLSLWGMDLSSFNAFGPIELPAVLVETLHRDIEQRN